MYDQVRCYSELSVYWSLYQCGHYYLLLCFKFLASSPLLLLFFSLSLLSNPPIRQNCLVITPTSLFFFFFAEDLEMTSILVEQVDYLRKGRRHSNEKSILNGLECFRKRGKLSWQKQPKWVRLFRELLWKDVRLRREEKWGSLDWTTCSNWHSRWVWQKNGAWSEKHRGGNEMSCKDDRRLETNKPWLQTRDWRKEMKGQWCGAAGWASASYTLILIPIECWLEIWLFLFSSNFLLMYMKRQLMVIPCYPWRWTGRSSWLLFWPAKTHCDGHLEGESEDGRHLSFSPSLSNSTFQINKLTNNP